MCQGDEDDKLKIDGYCIHTYKCPLDVLNTSRFNTVICLGDGTWDYKYPNCSDMLPVVSVSLTLLASYCCYIYYGIAYIIALISLLSLDTSFIDP